MTFIDRYTWGYLYILHFSKPLGNLKNRRGQAKHYLGWALEPEARIDLHLSGRSGVPIVEAALEAGITLTPHILGPAPKDGEYHLKHRTKRIAPFCPGCSPRPRPLPFSIYQLTLELDMDEPEAFPDAPLARIDWYEIQRQREWRSTRAGLVVPSGHLDDNLL